MVINGRMTWCQRCGNHSYRNLRGLAGGCALKPTSKGQADRLARLTKGQHPKRGTDGKYRSLSLERTKTRRMTIQEVVGKLVKEGKGRKAKTPDDQMAPREDTRNIEGADATDGRSNAAESSRKRNLARASGGGEEQTTKQRKKKREPIIWMEEGTAITAEEMDAINDPGKVSWYNAMEERGGDADPHATRWVRRALHGGGSEEDGRPSQETEEDDPALCCLDYG